MQAPRHALHCDSRPWRARWRNAQVPHFTAVIRPRIEYACAVWSGGPTQRLQRLQDSFSKRHGIMLPSLQKRFDYHTLVLLYRIREKLAPDHLFHYFPPSYRAHHTQAGHSLRKHSYPAPLQKKSATLNSFLPRAIILWNTLPFDVQSSKSLGMFKSKLKNSPLVVNLLHTFSHQPPSSTRALYLYLTSTPYSILYSRHWYNMLA